MAIHTFTLGTKPLGKKKYRHIRDRLLVLVKDNIIEKTKNHGSQYRMKGFRGVTITLNTKTIYRIELTVNPVILLGGGYADLFTATDETMRLLSDNINALLSQIGSSDSFEDLCLSRIDCTMDVSMPSQEDIAELIRCVQQTKLRAGYERESFNNKFRDYREKNKHSFRARCNDVCLTIYDKSFQLQEEGIMRREDIPPNRLRIETAFYNGSLQRVLNDHLDATVYDCQLGTKIMYFSDLSIQLILKYVNLILSPGRYMRFDLAKEEIEQSNFKKMTKELMIAFLYEVSRHHKAGVDGAIMDCDLLRDRADPLLSRFRELDLNPVTLPIRSEVQQLPSIAQLMIEEMSAWPRHADSSN